MKPLNRNTMKTIFFVSMTFLFFLISCDSQVNTKGQKVAFGIHEVMYANEIPIAIMDSLKSLGVEIENNPQKPVLGYITLKDSLVLHFDLSKENIKLMKMIPITDEEQKYSAIAGIRPNPIMSITSIKKTKARGNNVEIYFDMDGTKEWADFTKHNVGRYIAFVIDNQIYSIPLINAEIKHGIAMITGLKNETIAKTVSQSLNLSIPE